MDTKQTSGEWSYGESIDSMWYVAADCKIIAEVMAGEPGEAEANSMRMAAATDMLDALMHILRYDRDGLGAIGESLAKAAVRKALGHNALSSAAAVGGRLRRMVRPEGQKRGAQP